MDQHCTGCFCPRGRKNNNKFLVSIQARFTIFFGLSNQSEGFLLSHSLALLNSHLVKDANILLSARAKQQIVRDIREIWSEELNQSKDVQQGNYSQI